MPARNRNELWGRVLVDELARVGVRHVVIAPGSRSAPLVLAAASHPGLVTHVLLDERSAGFLALGIGKATGVPAAVVTTSGTAVANLLPAAVEATRSEVPLLLLTADRPARLRGTDANQTIDQVRIFGGYARLFLEVSPAEVSDEALRHLRSAACRAVSAALGEPAGPVHVNVGFDLPLEPSPVPGDLPEDVADGRVPGAAGRPDGAPWTRVHRSSIAPSEDAAREMAERLQVARRAVLVAGILPRSWETGPGLREAAAALGLPLLADALSGARFPCGGAGPSNAPSAPIVVGGYDLALRDRRAARELAPDLVIRVGVAPTSATLGEWLSGLEGVSQIVVGSAGDWPDHAGVATHMIRSDPGACLRRVLELGGPPRQEPGWLGAWERIEARVRTEVEARRTDDSFDGALVAEVGRRVGAADLLFVSGSLAVREIDTFLPCRNEPLLVIGNRGASGIDGIVSSAAGASLGAGRRVVAVVGDVALLHDANGLAALREPGVRVVLVVVNNDGGGIFHFLPIAQHEPAFTPYFVAPHGLDLSHLAALHGLRFLRARGRASDPGPKEGRSAEGFGASLERALAEETSVVLEIQTDREENRRRRTEVVAEIAAAAGDALTGERG